MALIPALAAAAPSNPIAYGAAAPYGAAALAYGAAPLAYAAPVPAVKAPGKILLLTPMRNCFLLLSYSFPSLPYRVRHRDHPAVLDLLREELPHRGEDQVQDGVRHRVPDHHHPEVLPGGQARRGPGVRHQVREGLHPGDPEDLRHRRRGQLPGHRQEGLRARRHRPRLRRRHRPRLRRRPLQALPRRLRGPRLQGGEAARVQQHPRQDPALRGSAPLPERAQDRLQAHHQEHRGDQVRARGEPEVRPGAQAGLLHRAPRDLRGGAQGELRRRAQEGAQEDLQGVPALNTSSSQKNAILQTLKLSLPTYTDDRLFALFQKPISLLLFSCDDASQLPIH